MHSTTMTGNQRKELIRILSVQTMGHALETLAELNDVQLAALWQRDCAYITQEELDEINRKQMGPQLFP
jgi:hypothetical protein